MPRSKRLTPRRPPAQVRGDLPPNLPEKFHRMYVEDWCPDPSDPRVVRLYEHETMQPTPVGMLQELVTIQRFREALREWCKETSDDPKAMWKRVRNHGGPRWRHPHV